MKLDAKFGGPGSAAFSPAEYEAMLAVLDVCQRARDLPDLRQRLLDALARYLGYRHTTFFVGPDFARVFDDARALVQGRAQRMVSAYPERFRLEDPFSHGEGLDLLEARGMASLLDLSRPSLAGARHYLDNFLMAHGIHAKLVVRLDSLLGPQAGIGMMAEDERAFDARDFAFWRRLRVHLGPLLASHVHSEGAPAAAGSLSRREQQVAELVSQGLTNRQVADALFISDETVKKHLTRVLHRTGLRSRTQLALAWSASARRPPTPPSELHS